MTIGSPSVPLGRAIPTKNMVITAPMKTSGQESREEEGERNH